MLLMTAAIAVVTAWCVSSYREWRLERAAIARLNDLSYWQVSEVSQDLLDQLPDDGGFRCGTIPSGVEIVHDSTLPDFLMPLERRLGVKIFQRVTRLWSFHVHDSEIVNELPNFHRLQTVVFRYYATPPNRRTSQESEFLGAIKLFAAINARIDVIWPDDPPTNVQEDQPIAIEDSLGGVDPFSGAAKPFSGAADPFGGDAFGPIETTEP